MVVIIHELQNHFSDAIIHPKNVYNAINLFQHNQKMSKTDAAEIYNKLIQLQRKEPGWFVEVRLEGKDNHLIRLF